MVTRRSLLGAALIGLVPGSSAKTAPDAIEEFRIAGSAATVLLRRGPAAAVLLHVCRRWHYEIAPLDTGEGGVTGYTTDRTTAAGFETNHRSGTAVALYPRAYPLGGSERLWPHQEAVVRDILRDCEGVVVWGGDLSPVKMSHFHVVTAGATLTRVADRLDTSRHRARRRRIRRYADG
ncbi:hypothetical protein [Paractinoplanes rishiriensis]|uniref:Uncharacterized protein n=1 Tax=Paractinoplanes rishiriensis TaxID=1050105 RepID=A0A919JSR2_9ACTN|nr:hypothetical protein [Actinoplanes rishiriensis]GIE93010.1 hypothetical protein Ari01nite_04750 [Actinoplanes rishiriensis]